jgi:hypothetical protein
MTDTTMLVVGENGALIAKTTRGNVCGAQVGVVPRFVDRLNTFSSDSQILQSVPERLHGEKARELIFIK